MGIKTYQALRKVYLNSKHIILKLDPRSVLLCGENAIEHIRYCLFGVVQVLDRLNEIRL